MKEELLARIVFDVDQAKEHLRDDPVFRRYVREMLDGGTLPRGNPASDYLAVTMLIAQDNESLFDPSDVPVDITEIKAPIARLRADLERAAIEADG